jgi:hypothetical protein
MSTSAAAPRRRNIFHRRLDALETARSCGLLALRKSLVRMIRLAGGKGIALQSKGKLGSTAMQAAEQCNPTQNR